MCKFICVCMCASIYDIYILGMYVGRHTSVCICVCMYICVTVQREVRSSPICVCCQPLLVAKRWQSLLSGTPVSIAGFAN